MIITAVDRNGSTRIELDMHVEPTYDSNNYYFSGDRLYFIRILWELNKLAPGKLRPCLSWNLDQPPEDANCNIVFYIGDEMFRRSGHFHAPGFVAKTGGVSADPFLNSNQPFALRWRLMLRECRNAVKRLGMFPRAQNQGTVFELPIGTYCPVPQKHPAPADRPIDVFYPARIGARKLSFSPRTWSRDRLLDELIQLSKTSTRKISLSGVGQEPELNVQDYAQVLGHSKVVICPRGNITETYRFLEAARAGCIIVSEPLPDRWYFDNHPALILSDWTDLPDVLTDLLGESD